MPDDATRCEELFMACAPFVRAEHEAEDNLEAARAELKAARKVAAAVRRAWVENILKHDHRALCLPRRDRAEASGEGKEDS